MSSSPVTDLNTALANARITFESLAQQASAEAARWAGLPNMPGYKLRGNEAARQANQYRLYAAICGQGYWPKANGVIPPRGAGREFADLEAAAVQAHRCRFIDLGDPETWGVTLPDVGAV